jgi:1,4-dihydroxy-2-naphthoate octaprenyltransferase
MINNWLEAFRLRTIPLSVSGIFMGSILAFYQGFVDYTIFGLSLVTTVLFQILSNLANDLGDSLKGTDNENRIGPTRSVQSGKISKTQMKTAIIIVAILSLISAFLLILEAKNGMNQKMIASYGILALICVIAAITYTIGKNAYGYYGLGDLMVLFFFGVVGVLGSFTLYSKEINWILLIPSFSIGFLSVAVLNLNNMRDQQNDALSKKNTLVVKIGFKKAKIYHFLLVISSFCLLIIFSILIHEIWFILSLLPFIFLFKHLKFVTSCSDPKKLDSELKKVAISTLFVSLFSGLGLLI